jgi:hypothetical protein
MAKNDGASPMRAIFPDVAEGAAAKGVNNWENRRNLSRFNQPAYIGRPARAALKPVRELAFAARPRLWHGSC